jgi:hypothetical protein
MPPIRRPALPRRNDPCPCNSTKKFKKCCGTAVTFTRPTRQSLPQYIDTGETPIRWVIVDDTGTRLFADKDNRALVFSSKDDAFATATHDLFTDQQAGDINVAGVGETKFQTLQEKVPYVEVNAEQAALLVQERVALARAQLEAAEQIHDDKHKETD